MKRLQLTLLIIFLLAPLLYAFGGLDDFDFNDTIEKIQETASGKCTLGKLQKSTRWQWKAFLDCSDYKFKKNVSVYLLFEFADGNLTRIYAVSKKIDNYLSFRYPHDYYDHLLPLKQSNFNHHDGNLADQLIYQDKVHKLEKQYVYTTYFHEGKWEWEFRYERPNHKKMEKRFKEKQLDHEKQKGVKKWNSFSFDDSYDQVKKEIEGLCSATRITSDLDTKKYIDCLDFSFLGEKIKVRFGFVELKLVKIELVLKRKWYAILLPILKKKYDFPYIELKENQRYYPYIEFPDKNIKLLHRLGDQSDAVLVSLKYLKGGVEDTDQYKNVEKPKKKVFKKIKSREEKIMDNI